MSTPDISETVNSTGDSEGKLGEYRIEIAEAYTKSVWGVTALYVNFTFTNESDKAIDDIPLTVTAYQDGAELESSINPNQAPTQPGGSAILETMFNLVKTDGEVTVRAEVSGGAPADAYEKILKLEELEERELELDVTATDVISYDFGPDSIPSIMAIVGKRVCTSSASGTDSDGNKNQEYWYDSKTIGEDLQTYLEFLVGGELEGYFTE